MLIFKRSDNILVGIFQKESRVTKAESNTAVDKRTRNNG
jgi:hypothetical protein